MLPALALVSSVLQLAPQLVGLFKGGEKSEKVAEIAATVARTVTGTVDNDSAVEALKTNPDKLVEYHLAMLAQATRLEELVYTDRQNARSRDVEYIKAGKRNYRADALVAISVLVVLVIIGVVVWRSELNEFAKGSLTTILGVFLNMLTNAYQFEFGQTRKGEENQTKITNEYIKS
jgi:hypothetical protein